MIAFEEKHIKIIILTIKFFEPVIEGVVEKTSVGA